MQTTITHDTLATIESDSAAASAQQLDYYVRLIEAGIAGAGHELVEHGKALMLKLKHLAAQQRAPQTVDADAQYLAPWLRLPEELARAA